MKFQKITSWETEGYPAWRIEYRDDQYTVQKWADEYYQETDHWEEVASFKTLDGAKAYCRRQEARKIKEHEEWEAGREDRERKSRLYMEELQRKQEAGEPLSITEYMHVNWKSLMV